MHQLLEGPSIVSYDERLRPGARIANARGIPGTLGCFALTLDDRRLVFLTSHHVLFGGGAGEQEPVSITVQGERRSSYRIGRSRHGRCGTVSHCGMSVHVDCATAELELRTAPEGCRVVEESASQTAALSAGDRVTKIGAATATTHGIVLDTDFADHALVNGRRHETRGQILVRPLRPGETFTANGDSGAVLRNHDGVVVGLLWGADARGYGLACPIAPVLRILHVCLARLESTGVS
jgi:hypothetical protein